MRRTHRIAAVLLFLGVVAIMQPAVSSAATKVKSTRLTVVVLAPKGVPGNVLVRSGGVVKVVSKQPAGRRTRRVLQVKPGKFVVTSVNMAFKGKFYSARIDRRRLRLTRGGAATVTVRIVALPVAQQLAVTTIGQTKIGLEWRAPKGSVVELRRTSGNSPARTVKQGVHVKMKGMSALDSKLKTGTKYTYALFTRTRTGWVGPVVLGVGTASNDSRVAKFAAPAETVIVTSADADVPTLTATGINVRLASSRTTPLVGAGFVMPVSKTLPGGFLGTVAAVSADGRTVSLVAGGIADAFDYYDIDVDLADIEPFALTPTVGAAALVKRPGGRPGEQMLKMECIPSGSQSIKLNPTVKPSGRFKSSVLKKKVKFAPDLPIGGKVDLSAKLEIAMTADIDMEAAIECGVKFTKVVKNFTYYPVPLALTFDPEAMVSIGGRLTTKDVGFTVKGGMWAKGQFGLGIKDDFDGGLIKDGDMFEGSYNWSARLKLSVGGELTVGPGGGLPEVGAIAGVAGSYYPLVAEVATVFPIGDSRADECVSAKVGYEAALKLVAKAWLGSWDTSASFEPKGLKTSGDYGLAKYIPAGCDKLPVPPKVPDASGVIGTGVTEITSTTTGDPEQVGMIDGLVPGSKAWVVSTGRVSDAAIEDPDYFASSDLDMPGSDLLSALIGNVPTNDAAVYSVTVKPTGDMLHVKYMFGSEEYPEFVAEGYDDVMAVFVNGVNCAMVPGTTDRVSVDTVNHVTNSEYFVDTSLGATGYATSMDGLTKPFTCNVPVTPGSKVTVEVHVADATDGIYDSVVGLVDKGIWSD